MKFRPLPILTLFTIPILVILFLLGNWQWNRYQFKLALEAAPPTAPIALEEALKSPKEFTKIAIDCKPASRLISVSATEFEQLGNRYFGAISCGNINAIYEYGFVGDKEMARGETMMNGEPNLRTIAVLRKSKKPNAFIPDNAPPEHFYWPDVALFAKVLNAKNDVAGFYLTPITMSFNKMRPRANPYADEKGATYVEPGRHLGYALTWWGLFISLIAFYVAVHIKNDRLKFKD